MDTIESRAFVTEGGIEGSYTVAFLEGLVNAEGVSLRQRNIGMRKHRNDVDRLAERLESAFLENRTLYERFAAASNVEEVRPAVLARVHTAVLRTKDASISNVTFQGISASLSKSLWETWREGKN